MRRKSSIKDGSMNGCSLVSSIKRFQHSQAVFSASTLKRQKSRNERYLICCLTPCGTFPVMNPVQEISVAVALESGASDQRTCWRTEVDQPPSAPATWLKSARVRRGKFPTLKIAPRMYSACISSSFHVQSKA